MNRKGFTLIELMISIAVIGILAGIALAFLGFHTDEANDLRVESELKSLYSFSVDYYVDNGSTFLPLCETVTGENVIKTKEVKKIFEEYIQESGYSYSLAVSNDATNPYNEGRYKKSSTYQKNTICLSKKKDFLFALPKKGTGYSCIDKRGEIISSKTDKDFNKDSVCE